MIRYYKYLLVLINVIASIIITYYYTNPIKAVINGISWGLLISIPFVLIILGFEYLLKSNKLLILISIVLATISLSAIFIIYKNAWNPSPAVLFNQVFQIDVPKSVTDLHASICYPAKDRIFRLKFNIDKTDWNVIVNNLDKFEVKDNIKREFMEKNESFRLELEKEFSDLSTKSPDFLLYLKLNVIYLLDCDQVSWWDLKHLENLPQYEWINEKERSVEDQFGDLWLESVSPNVLTVYICGG